MCTRWHLPQTLGANLRLISPASFASGAEALRAAPSCRRARRPRHRRSTSRSVSWHAWQMPFNVSSFALSAPWCARAFSTCAPCCSRPVAVQGKLHRHHELREVKVPPRLRIERLSAEKSSQWYLCWTSRHVRDMAGVTDGPDLADRLHHLRRLRLLDQCAKLVERLRGERALPFRNHGRDRSVLRPERVIQRLRGFPITFVQLQDHPAERGRQVEHPHLIHRGLRVGRG